MVLSAQRSRLSPGSAGSAGSADSAGSVGSAGSAGSDGSGASAGSTGSSSIVVSDNSVNLNFKGTDVSKQHKNANSIFVVKVFHIITLNFIFTMKLILKICG